MTFGTMPHHFYDHGPKKRQILILKNEFMNI